MIELSIRRPVAVTVGVILVVLFGILSLLGVPVQLTPDIVKPQITVETRWLGKSPQEIEREIIDEQEEQLKGVEGVSRITSESMDSLGRITLEFPAGTDLDAALIKVSNRLQQVPEYPEDADKPVIATTNTTDNAMAWFMLRRLAGNDREMDTYFRLAEDFVKPRLERVSGVASSNVFGGREEELQVILRPDALAARGLTVTQVIEAIDRENQNISGGDFDEGKRTYKVRTVGEYMAPADLEKVVLESADGRRVYLRDIAEVREGMKKRESFVRQKGVPTIAVNCLRSAEANVMETMEGVRRATAELNRGFLAERRLELVQVYDETEYIEQSIDRVLWNLVIGSALAVTVLFLFLRSVASTFVVAVSIPISVIGSFVLLFLFGRSVNVISLAGMSFAAGMVVDNAIVSLENIYRLRQEGKGRFEAALEGAREVWGAILASTLTTIAVFLPVLFVEERAGQLFRDIAIAISCSVGLSLLVSITVIPALSSRLLRAAAVPTASERSATLFERFRGLLVAAVAWVSGRFVWRLVTIIGLTGASAGLAWLFLPEAEYLPEGNTNLAFGILIPPPGYSLDEIEAIGRKIEGSLDPLMSDEVEEPEEGAMPRAAAEGRREPPRGAEELRPEAASLTPEEARARARYDVTIRHFFFVARQGAVFLGASAVDPASAGNLVHPLREAVDDIPGFMSNVQQRSLFERGISTGRRIDIEISGPELERLVGIGGMIFGRVMQLFPIEEGNQTIPIPSLDLQTPEVRVIPDRERARDLGLDARSIGIAVDTIIDGTKASEYKLQGREVDLTVMGSRRERDWRTQDLDDVPIFTPEGKLVSLGSVADVVVTRGPQQINHIERDRSITIQLSPAKHIPLERAVRTVREDVVEPLRAQGLIAPPYRLRLAGTVDDLYQAFTAFRWNFVLAVVITYLLMSALFENFLYPFIILFTLPLAAAGGVLCLALVHAFVPDVRFDILTMLGFVILVGVVVNNAILIVYRGLQSRRAGEPTRDAITGAVGSRIRPIFMTTLTSGFGMLPLVIFPGAGSELYRGLGSVVVGGLVVSTVFTIFLIPSLLSLVWALEDRLGAARGAEAKP